MHDAEGHAATLPDGRTYRVEVVTPTVTPDERVFALLDRAQMAFELKASATTWSAGCSGAGSAVLALQGLDLSPTLLGAISEILLAR